MVTEILRALRIGWSLLWVGRNSPDKILAIFGRPVGQP